MPVWSKLKSGRIPQWDELFDIINNQMSLSKSQFIPPPGAKLFKPEEHQGEEQKHNQQTSTEPSYGEDDTPFSEGIPEQQQQEGEHQQTNEFGEFDNEDERDEL